MVVFSRGEGQGVVIGGKILVKVVEVMGDQVRLRISNLDNSGSDREVVIQAPSNVLTARKEFTLRRSDLAALSDDFLPFA